MKILFCVLAFLGCAAAGILPDLSLLSFKTEYVAYDSAWQVDSMLLSPDSCQSPVYLKDSAFVYRWMLSVEIPVQLEDTTNYVVLLIPLSRLGASDTLRLGKP